MAAPIMLVLLWGPVTFVLSALAARLLLSSSPNALRIAANPSEGLDLSSIRNLCSICSNVWGLGLILLFVYVCEADVVLPVSSEKHYDRDQFLFLLLLVLGGCMASWHPPSSDAPRASFLNRNQTVEWKGWMQITILLYKYSGCDEYQPLFQTLIAAFVWMTAFGHTTSFLRGGDTRLPHVLWRLGFLSVLLSLTLHSVQLYGAVILHGCCFVLVYITMRVMRQVNSTQWGLRTKVMVLSLVLLLLVWDPSSRSLNPRRALSSLGSKGLGDLYYQAHLYLIWPSLLGMTFALNMPVATLFFQKLEDGDSPFLHVGGKFIIGSFLVLACFCFARKLFSDSNSVDDNSFSYFSVAFLLAYIFLRNITLWIRGHSNPILTFIGETTLELHLLHHHIWLTAGSTRVLVLVTGYPKVNFLLCSGIFVLSSRHAQQTTQLLRDAVWNQPPSRSAALLLYCVASAGAASLVGGLLHLPFVFLWSVVLGFLSLQRIFVSYTPADRPRSHERIAVFFGVFGVILMCTLLSIVFRKYDQMPITAGSPISVNCETAVLQGDWFHVNTCDETILGQSRRHENITSLGTCDSLAWGWEHSEETCRFSARRPEELLRHLNGRNVTFLGDSIVRHLYHASCRLLGDSRAGVYNTSAEKHSDYSKVYANTVRMEFRWAPYVANISTVLENVIYHAQGPDLLVMGGGAWDRLHMYGTTDEQAKLLVAVTALKEQMQAAVKSVVPIVWVSPTAMNSWALNTEEKRQNIREDQMVQFRDLFGMIGIYDVATFVLHGTSFTSTRVDESYDGVHYPFPIYDGGAQLLANAYDWLLEAPPGNVSQQNDEKQTNLLLAFIMMCIIGTALFLMDSFVGLSYIVAWLNPSLRPRKLYEDCTPWLDQQVEEWKGTKCSDHDEDEMILLSDKTSLDPDK